MKKYKVRINKAPQMELDEMAYGGQKNHALDLGSKNYGHFAPDQFAFSNTMSPVPRDMANIEAERGETAYGDVDGDGMMEHMNIGGKRHSQGGTPLNVKPGTFIYSDTAKMKIGGETLAMFGKSANSKKKYTPAQLAKQYDINKYKAILENPKSDNVQKRTAQMMIETYQKKLAELALVQEGMKGFPQGIPEVAQPYVGQMMGAQEEGVSSMSEMAYGGIIPKFQGDVNGSTVKLPSWFKLWTNSNTLKGKTSSTGKITTFDPNDSESIYKDYEYWKQIAGREFTGPKDYQKFVFGKIKETDPTAIDSLVKEYGLPAAGKLDDGIFGKRTATLSKYRIPEKPVDPQKTVEEPKTVTEKDKPLGVPDPKEFKKTSPSGFFNPDKVKIANSLIDLASNQKFMPWEAPMTLPNAGFVGYSPERELASNASAANTQMNMNAMFGSPQQMAARNSQVSGQAAENAANILARYNNLNVGQAQKSMDTQLELDTKQALFNANRATSLWDKTQKVNQNYLNFNRAARNKLVGDYSSAFSNMMNANIADGVNPFFAVDRNTGEIIKTYTPSDSFFETKPGIKSSTSQSLSGINDSYLGNLKTQADKIKQTFPELTYEQALSRAEKLLGVNTRTSTKDTNNDNIPESVFKTYYGNMNFGPTQFYEQ